MEETNSEILVLTEFETKYKTTEDKLFPFKRLMDAQEEQSSFVYVESDDVYFVRGPVKEADRFIRLRFANHKNIKEKFFTAKKKLNNKNSIQRIEVDLRIDPTGDYLAKAREFCDIIGYVENFRITKFCHIYNFPDAVLVYYSVIDLETQKLDHFMEIEVNEHLKFTEDQAWDIIVKWEKVLEPLGISYLSRSTYISSYYNSSYNIHNI